MKKILWIVASLFVVMVVSASVGTVLFFRDYEEPVIIKKNVDVYKNINVDGLKSLDIDIGNSDVEILAYNGSDISLHLYGFTKSNDGEMNVSLNAFVNGNELVVSKGSSYKVNKFKLFEFDEFHNVELKLDVLVPRDMVMDLKVSSSRLIVKDLNFNDFDVDVFSGDVLFENLVVKDLKFDSGSSKIIFENVVSENLDFDSWSGDIFLRNIDVKNSVNLDGGSGKLNVFFKNGSYSEKFEISSSSGDILVDGLNSNSFVCDFHSSKNVFRNLNVGDISCKTSSGDLNFEGLSFEKASFILYSGDLSLDVNNLGDLNVDISSGDVVFDLNEGESFDLNFDSYSGKFESSFPIVLNSESDLKISGVVGDKVLAKDIFVKSSSGNLIIN